MVRATSKLAHLALFCAGDRGGRRALSQQNYPLKNEGCFGGRKAGNSACDKLAVFYGCLLVEIGNVADRQKSKGRILPLNTKVLIRALSHSDSLDFLRCPSLRFLRNDSRANSTGLKSGCSGDAFLVLGTLCCFAMCQLSGSDLAFLRCSDLSLRPQASSTHAEKLAPEFSAFSRSTLASISSTNSYGNLIPLYADLLFLCPVAIEDDSCWCFNTRENKSSLQICEVFKYFWLDVFKHLDIRYLNTLSTAKAQVRHKNSEARRCDNTNGPLTQPLVEVTVMAGSQHTQTHPKFTWRFLALNRHDKKAAPCRLSVEAATEREARRILAPHFILSLAARLPVAEVRHA